MKMYSTKDLYLASILVSKGESIEKLETVKNNYWFIFSNYQDCNKLITDHWKGKLEVNSKAFVEAIRSLKTYIFVERDREKLPN